MLSKTKWPTASPRSLELGSLKDIRAFAQRFLARHPRLHNLEDCHVAAVNDAPDARDGVKSYALDPESAERLWEVSEKLVGERFALSP